MRYLIALAFCFIFLSSQAQACRGHILEDTLFFETLPNPPLNANLIAKVSLSEVSRGTATAEIIQVLQTSDPEVRLGEKLPIQFSFSSCGPNHKNGAKGIIIAKAGIDSVGRLVLYPYMRRYSDGRITPPYLKAGR
ncbi:hypothetical protein IB234_23770 [Pseudomonas sp. PDM16]|uniref:hypothetical protein n=1 Tax=Pseudomonas sp. PDM16 TaxID=2769292 RepID=UPI00178392DC|nr:hypothetical protein [Pseudomonas sp. PDM16]MBD9417587.1 hypothetical protein [Pseudomonas sp. PDM16]